MLLGSIRLGCFLLQVLEDVLNDLRVFDTGNHLDLTTAVFADFNVDVEDALEPLHPGHGAMSFLGHLIGPFRIRRGCLFGLLATLRWRHINPVFAVGGKNAVKAGQVDPRLGNQGG